MTTLPAYWVNGTPDGTLSPSDRGFSYGDGLFETFRCLDGHIHLWNYHWRRLRRGMDALGLFCSRDRIEAQLQTGKQFLQSHGVAHAAGRLAVSRGPGERGYGGRAGAPTLVFSLHDLSHWRRDATPVEVTICTTRLAEQIRLAGIKHSNRLEQVLAARELIESDAEEGLQMNSDDELVCAVSANLFFGRDGELFTPPIDRCGVAGTVRQLIIDELAPAAGVPVRVAPVKRELLPDFDELFLTNALQGIRSVSRCGEHRFTSTHWGDTLRSSFYSWSESTGW
jgi:4-amino-4-deoxychorismate lyase